MKASIELNLEDGVYAITYQIPGGVERHGHGQFRLHPVAVESIASGYKEASWMLTSAILADLNAKCTLK